MSSEPPASDQNPPTDPAATRFKDTSTDCAICLTSLSDQPCLTLTCGHIWHESCLRAQLLHSQPNPAKRLLFSGCRCAKCSAFCDHPALSDVARAHLDLSAKVDELIIDQLHVDGVQMQGKYALEYGRRTYAFYLCALCKEPYFGGTIECADEDDRDLPPDDRLCQKCSPRTTKVCGHADHRAFYVWKCRYCCQRASYVCYGNTHFCLSCHEKNSNRRRGEVMTATECPGAGRCTTPLPEGHESHKNGPEPDCELLLYCAWCESDSSQVISWSERGSPNMVYNPSGEQGTSGWHPLSVSGWRPEQSEHPLRDCPVNFVSTCNWCVMAQVVNLTQFIRNPSNAFIEVSARYMARWDCPSVFKLEGALFDSNCNRLKHFQTDPLPAPADYWDQSKHIFQPTPGAHFALISVSGKDTRFWAGDYGSKVADCSIRVLFDDSVEDEAIVLVPGAFESIEPPDAMSVCPVILSHLNAQALGRHRRPVNAAVLLQRRQQRSRHGRGGHL